MNKNSGINRITLLMVSAFIFAYCFGVSVHEIGHIVAYQYYGISTEILVLDPFGHSYMEPVRNNAAGELLQRSGGSLFNVTGAFLISALFWKKHSLYAFPILMWSGVAFIQESIAIILDVINGQSFDWAFVVSEGVPVYLVLILSAIFMTIGCTIFLRLLAIAGIRANDSYKNIIIVCLLSITSFFILSLVYVSFFLVSDQDNWVLSKSFSLAASIILSFTFSMLFKPSYALLDRILPIRSQIIKNSHLVSSILLTMFYVMFCAFYFN